MSKTAGARMWSLVTVVVVKGRHDRPVGKKAAVGKSVTCGAGRGVQGMSERWRM